MRLGNQLSAALAALFLATAAQAQPAPKPIDAAERQATVTEAAKWLRSEYIYPDVGERAAAALERGLAEGSYDSLTDRKAFAARLTDAIAAIAHDKHMRISSRSAPPPSPMGNGPAPRREGGFTRADRLPGNIGYIEVVGFPPLDVFAPIADRAMTALADTKALIIDLRRNGGGQPSSVSYLVGFLMPPKTHVNDLIWRNGGSTTFRTESFYTPVTPVAYGKPVYVLTSRLTFSGGEEFAYDLKALKRATLIGEVTGGGANPTGLRRLGDDMMLFVPGGRAENPITKTSWEGKGVEPDVPVAATDALKVALQRLGGQPASGEIEALSQARVFAPRTTAQPGSEAALRAGIPQLIAGAPDYAQMTASLADMTRGQLPDLQKQLTALGALKSITFRQVDVVGGDVYDVVFEHGAVWWTVVMGSDGKLAVSFLTPA